MENISVYRVVVQTKAPGKSWEDHSYFPVDEAFDLSEIDKEFIEQIKREYAQDLPRFEVRTVNRKVKI